MTRKLISFIDDQVIEALKCVSKDHGISKSILVEQALKTHHLIDEKITFLKREKNENI